MVNPQRGRCGASEKGASQNHCRQDEAGFQGLKLDLVEQRLKLGGQKDGRAAAEAGGQRRRREATLLYIKNQPFLEID
jgi:hypothetical protein